MELNYSSLKYTVILLVLLQQFATSVKSQVITPCPLDSSDSSYIASKIKILAKADSFYMIKEVYKKDANISGHEKDKIRHQFNDKTSAIQLLFNEKLKARQMLNDNYSLIYNNLRIYYLAKRGYLSYSSYILGHLNVPQGFKDTLINDPDIADFIKARLGDKESEKRVIDTFNKFAEDTANFECQNFKKYAEQLLYINSKQSIYAYFKAFENPYIHVEKYFWEGYLYVDKSSYAALLLGLLHKVYMCKEEYNFKYNKNKSLESNYREIEELIKRDFGVTIKITSPFYYK